MSMLDGGVVVEAPEGLKQLQPTASKTLMKQPAVLAWTTNSPWRKMARFAQGQSKYINSNQSLITVLCIVFDLSSLTECLPFLM